MASSSPSKGSVPTVEWWKHLRDNKRPQNKRVRRDGKKQIADTTREHGVSGNEYRPG